MIEILNQFLFKHQYLALKGIGTVEINANQPFYNELNNEILPPALSINLSTDISEEKEVVLITYLSKKLQLHDDASKELYQKFCRYIEGILKKGQSFDWSGIFHLNYNTNGQYEIYPNNQLANLQPAVKVKAAKPVNIIEVEKQVVTEPPKVEEVVAIGNAVQTSEAIARAFLEEESKIETEAAVSDFEEEVERRSGVKKWLAAILIFIAVTTLIVIKYMNIL